jgi:hypothetical protein
MVFSWNFGLGLLDVDPLGRRLIKVLVGPRIDVRVDWSLSFGPFLLLLLFPRNKSTINK